MINKIWGVFILIGIIFSLFTGNVEIVNKEILEVGKLAIDMIVRILPILCLWLGIMRIAVESGLLDKLSKMIYPFLHFIFPDIPKDHEALGFIASNIVVNMFGLGSAATPFGLKAMKSLQKLNNKKEEASRSMITFLVLNTSGVTIIPTTVISLRLMYGSVNPTEIIVTAILAAMCSSTFGLLMDRVVYKFRGVK